jgi:hypothetical protein
MALRIYKSSGQFDLIVKTIHRQLWSKIDTPAIDLLDGEVNLFLIQRSLQLKNTNISLLVKMRSEDFALAFKTINDTLSECQDKKLQRLRDMTWQQ